MRYIGARSYYDTLEEMVLPGRAALIVIDQQNDFCHERGYYNRFGLDTSMVRAITPNINRLATAARVKGVPVVFTRNIIARGYISDSPVWLATHALVGLHSLDQEDFYTLEGSWGSEVFEDCIVHPDDIIMDKHRATVFHNTPLDTILRSSGIETVICTGQVTHGCVDNSLRNARDRDYYTVLVEDAVASTDRGLHDHTLETWRRRIPVPTTQDVLEAWGEGG